MILGPIKNQKVHYRHIELFVSSSNSKASSC